ncbi:hypothetical protein HC031_02195 [Planosporangium thailandense]|uniref:GNAT family N-acetyltransferase n=1 Tax=Planosporangium thailandense TaxID=765197 RepID=A0ABX0XTH7_9ACTN|nr:hypothetical protein [Planosporangium thailandense]NJC68539.1 hypothetical protein [Planosporangium thailandense]
MSDMLRGSWPAGGHVHSEWSWDALARDFPRGTALAEAHGFRPGRRPHDLWVRA